MLLLLVDDAQVLSHWLQKFVLSTRKKSGANHGGAAVPENEQHGGTVMNNCIFNIIQGPQ